MTDRSQYLKRKEVTLIEIFLLDMSFERMVDHFTHDVKKDQSFINLLTVVPYESESYLKHFPQYHIGKSNKKERQSIISKA